MNFLYLVLDITIETINYYNAKTYLKLKLEHKLYPVFNDIPIMILLLNPSLKVYCSSLLSLKYFAIFSNAPSLTISTGLPIILIFSWVGFPLPALKHFWQYLWYIALEANRSATALKIVSLTIAPHSSYLLSISSWRVWSKFRVLTF